MRVRSLDALARLQLRRGGPWRVHSVFQRACNLIDAHHELLGIVIAAKNGNAPTTLVLAPDHPALPLTAVIAPGDSARLHAGALLIGRRLQLVLYGATLWSPEPIRRTLTASRTARQLDRAAEIAVTAARRAGGLAPLLPDALALVTPVYGVGLPLTPRPPPSGDEGRHPVRLPLSRVWERGAGGERPLELSTDVDQPVSTADQVVERARGLVGSLAGAIRERCWADVHAPARALSGLGPGLTPSGDDLLAGLVLGLRAGLGSLPAPFAAAITSAVEGRTTDLALARVRHAVAGRPDEVVHQLLRALVTGTDGDLEAAVGAALDYGHSSGADTLVGMLIGVQLGVQLGNP